MPFLRIYNCFNNRQKKGNDTISKIGIKILCLKQYTFSSHSSSSSITPDTPPADAERKNTFDIVRVNWKNKSWEKQFRCQNNLHLKGNMHSFELQKDWCMRYKSNNRQRRERRDERNRVCNF